MAASPWTLISMAICLLVVRQLPSDVQERAEEAKKSFHEAASAGVERAQDLAEKARSHLAQRVRRSLSADYRYGPTGQKLGPRFQSRIRDSFSRIGDLLTDGRSRRDVLEVAEEMSREGEERWRERRERGRERHEREREREEDEREREERERERERHERQRERGEKRREREERDRY